MPSNARCWRQLAAALAVAMILLTACARVDSEEPRDTCTPMVEYGPAEQAHVAKEIAALPEGALMVGWQTTPCCASKHGLAHNRTAGVERK